MGFLAALGQVRTCSVAKLQRSPASIHALRLELIDPARKDGMSVTEAFQRFSLFFLLLDCKPWGFALPYHIHHQVFYTDCLGL